MRVIAFMALLIGITALAGCASTMEHGPQHATQKELALKGDTQYFSQAPGYYDYRSERD